MFMRIFVIFLLSISISAFADIPDPATDPLKLEADFVGTEILAGLSFASSNCRQSFDACGDHSSFLQLDGMGITDDGQVATIWIERWFPEPMTFWAPIWSEVIYMEFWTGSAPFTDYSAASAVVHGVTFWDFVDKVLDAALANRKDKVSISTPGWYGVHLDDFSAPTQTAGPAGISITANITKIPGADVGEVSLNYSITAK